MLLQFIRHMASKSPSVHVEMCKVGVIGANGGIGRHLALLLKLNEYVTDISLYSTMDTRGVAVDLSHINTKARVWAYSGDEKNLIESLKCCDLVVIVTGLAYSEKIKNRSDLFEANAELMVKLTKAIASACHDKMPLIHIVTNPVNAMVPICAEYLKSIGCYDPRKVTGSSSIDSMRARTFLTQLKHVDPGQYVVPVVGGHSSKSITPLLSQIKPPIELTLEEQKQLADRIINGFDEVVKAKKGTGTAQLAVAHCVAHFCNSFFRTIYGEKHVMEAGFVPADVNEMEFFACDFLLDKNGVKECQRLPPMREFEIELYYRAVEYVKKSIDRAKEFVGNYLKKEKEKHE